MQTPMGTKVYFKTGQSWQEFGCVTSIAGISASVETRDRTSLVDAQERSVPTVRSTGAVSLTVNLSSLQELQAWFLALGIGTNVQVAIRFTGTATSGTGFDFTGFIDSVELSDIAAFSALNYVLSFKLINDLQVIQ